VWRQKTSSLKAIVPDQVGWFRSASHDSATGFILGQGKFHKGGIKIVAQLFGPKCKRGNHDSMVDVSFILGGSRELD
jgi:hypothetical protein